MVIKIKNTICACSIVSRVLIYASNKPLCGTLKINLGRQTQKSFQESNKNAKYVLPI